MNGAVVGTWKLDRPGLFLLEGDLPLADEYTVTINASPTFTIDTDDRTFTVNLSMIRLVGEQTNEPRH